MSRALTQAIRDIADERQLPWELVREIFEESLKEAIARKMDLTGDIQIRVSETTGDIRIVITQKVVHRPKEPGEITLRQARKYIQMQKWVTLFKYRWHPRISPGVLLLLQNSCCWNA